MSLTGKDIDMDRSQGEVGLFVPDAGYPFGVMTGNPTAPRQCANSASHIRQLRTPLVSQGASGVNAA
jgi:hypothetical protein